MTANNSTIDLNFLKQYDKAGPRYTSYPTAPEWRDDFAHDDYKKQLTVFQEQLDPSPVSLYFHIPFCQRRCYYCGCHSIIDNNRLKIDQYLQYLEKELDLLNNYIGKKLDVCQLHWGGGTPTFLNEPQLEQLFNAIAGYYNFVDDAELAIEVNPCFTSKNQLTLLRNLGFNRISMGVQDFNPDVQRAINRTQSAEMTTDLIKHARQLNFSGVNLDLIYGLPLQTKETFKHTIDRVLDILPDRIALFSYAKIPWLKPHQKNIRNEDLPPVDEKFSIFLEAREQLLAKGYIAIGMDHFALPDDELALAIKNKTLHRNFMGYTVKSSSHFLGFGISSIGYVNEAYVQNVKTLAEYYRLLDKNSLPVDKGMVLNEDDLIRQWVISSLMCHFELDFLKFKQRFQRPFEQYFREELQDLTPFIEDNLMDLESDRIYVKERGTLFIRNIAMIFDQYLKNKQKEKRFSQTI